MNSDRPVWLGHCRTGGRLCLRDDDMSRGMVVLGAGADGVAAVLASACRDSGLRTFVVDLGGGIAERVTGRFDVRGLGYFLYDSERMEERASLHAELAASAYTMSLNLNFEQEGFLNSAIQYIGLEQGVASPSSLIDRLIATGEFRGHTSDELRGKLGALRSLNLTGEIGAVSEMLEGDTVASFEFAESNQAAEVGAMLLLAKVLAVGASGGRLPEVLVVNGANRLFPRIPVVRHTNKLLSALLSAQVSRVFASEVVYGLDERILDVAPVRVLSSALANGGRGRVAFGGSLHRSGASGLLVTPNFFVLQDSARGYEETFVPRALAKLQGEVAPVVQPQRDDAGLVKRILETLSSYDHATRGSVVGFLSSDEPPEEVQKAIDRLQTEGHLAVVGKDVKTDSPLQTFRLTQSGYELLRSLS
jgi:hypothetical protein